MMSERMEALKAEAVRLLREMPNELAAGCGGDDKLRESVRTMATTKIEAIVDQLQAWKPTR